MKNVKDNNICKVHFDVDPRPAQEAEARAKRHAVIIRQINAAALRYSRGFTDEDQRKYFLRGVAFALRPTLELPKAVTGKAGHLIRGSTPKKNNSFPRP